MLVMLTPRITTPLNLMPTDITLSKNTVAENAKGAIIGTLATKDPDAAETHTYAVSDSRFEVVNGQLKLKADQALNYEATKSLTVKVTATDKAGLSFAKDFNIAVQDDPNYPVAPKNELPPQAIIDAKGNKWVYHSGDEFNGTTLDQSKWFIYGDAYATSADGYNATYGHNMGMIQTYDESMVKVTDGALVIGSSRVSSSVLANPSNLVDGAIISTSEAYAKKIANVGSRIYLDANGNINQSTDKFLNTGKTVSEYLDSKGVVLKVVEVKNATGKITGYKVDNTNGTNHLFVEKWQSGAISTRETDYLFPLFSRVDVRAKIANAEGLWHGPWMRHFKGATTAELDLNENFVLEQSNFNARANYVGKQPATNAIGDGTNISTQSIHLWDSAKNNGVGGLQSNVNNGQWQEKRTYVDNLAGEYHVYSVQVERVKANDGSNRDEALITYLIDGVESYWVQTDLAKGADIYNKFIKDAQVKDSNGNDRLAHGWDFIFQGGIGSEIFNGSHGTMGLPDESLKKTQSEIDYIRVYVKEEDAKAFAQKNAETDDKTIKAQTGMIELIGTDSDNILIGNELNNVIRGFGGDDVLIGGLGRDTLIGSVGRDVFSFETAFDGNRDIITVFDKGYDKINLSSLIFQGLTADTFDKYIVIGKSTDGVTELGYDPKGQDSLSNARSAKSSFAYVQASVELDKSDFLIDMKPII